MSDMWKTGKERGLNLGCTVVPRKVWPSQEVFMSKESQILPHMPHGPALTSLLCSVIDRDSGRNLGLCANVVMDLEGRARL
ncbi:rCG51719 [Rattus norvegicus]|uniref:RCG51719 n=1 Tax=Rattus norvegicus TaxID=10116 RepID=A6K379_RAT|nr:rCG51719 [Rattus norvegicus]